MKLIKDMTPEEAAYKAYYSIIKYILDHKELHEPSTTLWRVKFSDDLVKLWENMKSFEEQDKVELSDIIKNIEQIIDIKDTGQ